MRSSTTRSNLCLLDRTRRSNYDRRLIVYLFSFLRIQLKPMRRYRRDLTDRFEKPSTSHAESIPYPHIFYWWKQNRNTSLSKRCFTVDVHHWFVLQEHRFVLSAWFVEQSAELSTDEDESLDRTVDLPFLVDLQSSSQFEQCTRVQQNLIILLLILYDNCVRVKCGNERVSIF